MYDANGVPLLCWTVRPPGGQLPWKGIENSDQLRVTRDGRVAGLGLRDCRCKLALLFLLLLLFVLCFLYFIVCFNSYQFIPLELDQSVQSLPGSFNFIFFFLMSSFFLPSRLIQLHFFPQMSSFFLPFARQRIVPQPPWLVVRGDF